MADMAALWEEQQAAITAPEFQPGNLATKFLEPPFSVLDSRGGRWQDRRRAWLSLGIKSEIGRGALASGSVAVQGGQGGDLMAPLRASVMGDARAFSHDLMKGEDVAEAGISIFDPVLCELAYRWWAPEGGHVLDPFAGGSVRGIVAAKLGHPYTGVDLSAPQIDANRAQAAALLAPTEPVPTWRHGDSRDVLAAMPDEPLFDMVFSCPPYFDLEVYSDDPADLSNMSWPEFLISYEAIIAAASARLRRGHFAVFVVSEIRDQQGMYRGLVPRTIHSFAVAGMQLYNEAILINSVGSGALRATKQMEASRKLVRLHQNILCFVKGEPPRGWSYDRPAPPSPQLDLQLGDIAPSGPAPVPAAAAAPEVAPEGATADDGQPGPFVACTRPYCILPAGHAMGHDLALPEVIEPVLIVTDDGRLADVATGELLEADGTPVEPDVLPGAEVLAAYRDEAWPELVGTWPDQTAQDAPAGPEGGSDLQVAPRVGGTPVVGPRTPAVPAPMALEAWLLVRDEKWNLADPNRPCYGCGRPATGEARDGSPTYDHSHHPEVLAMFGDPQ